MNASIKLIAAIAAMNAAGFTINAETLQPVTSYSSKKCFDEPDEDQGYYSNDDFVCLLSKEEKEALDNLEI